MPSLAFNPRAWYWLVGGDTAQAWSSAAGAYVTAYPADRVTHIDSEASLAAVLAAYGPVSYTHLTLPTSDLV